MGHRLTACIGPERIARRVAELAGEIRAAYPGDGPLVCVCVLKGAFLFFADLVRQIGRPLEIDFVRLASYGAATSRGAEIVFSKDLDVSIEGKDVLIVEDIVDTGHSMAFLGHVLATRHPKSLKICALIDKQERRERSVRVDFPGFALDRGFLVGYGLDYAERYRELDGIFHLSAT